MTRVATIGLGKLGLPVSVAMSQMGHKVYGYDADEEKVGLYRQGVPATGSCEPGLWGDLGEALLNGLYLCDSVEEALSYEPEIVFVAVPTPSLPDGRFDTFYVKVAIQEVVDSLRVPTVISVISTVLPMTIRGEVATLVGDNPLVYNPSFIAMSSVVRDFKNPEFVMVGTRDGTPNDVVESFYRTIVPQETPILHMTWENAELVKVRYNTYIGFKILIANECMEACHKIPHADCDVVSNALKMATKRVASGAYFKGGMGDGGECVNPATRLIIKNTLIPIGASKNVISRSGEEQKVLGTYSRDYEGEMFEITARGATPVSFTPNHPIYVNNTIRKLDGQSFGDPKTSYGKNKTVDPTFIGWKRASQIVRGDVVFVPKPKIQEIEILFEDNFMEFLGWWLAEGSKGKARLRIGQKDEHITKHIAKLTEDKYNTTIRKHRQGHYVISIYGKELSDDVASWFGVGSKNKRLPDWLLNGNKEKILPLLKGYLFGDGTISDRVAFYTSSYGLKDQLCWLFLRLGYYPFLSHTKTKREYKGYKWVSDQWRISFSRIMGNKLLRDLGLPEIDGINRRYLVEGKNGYFVPITKTKKTQYSGEVMNLETEDETYSVPFVVHNCHPRDQRALAWQGLELGLSTNLNDYTTLARAAQTEWLATLLREYGLPIVIMGKRFKARSNLTTDSASILLHDILKASGIESWFYDPQIGLTDIPEGPCVFLASIDEDWVNLYPYPPFSVVVDVWRRFKPKEIDLLEEWEVKYVPVGRGQ